jgi:preprotein translocase subunit SecY
VGPVGVNQMPSSLLADGQLLRRVAVTLAVLAVYRLGEWVPLPGLDLTALMSQYRPGELTSMIERLSIFSLGVTPILSALIIHEIAKIAVPPFARWEAASLQRRKDIERWTFLLALAFAGFQGNGIAVALESLGGLVPHPGLEFRASCIATFVAATALIIWLVSLINRFGVGSGFWILLAAPLLVRLPWLFYLQYDMWGPAVSITGTLMLGLILVSALGLVALSKADTTLVPSEQLLWPPILAYAAPGFLYLPFVFLLPQAQATALLDTLKAGHPVRLVLIAVLTLLFFLLRERRLFGDGVTSPLQATPKLPPLVPALALAAIATVSDFLVSLFALPLMIDGRALIIILAVALSVLAAAKDVREH